jgi:hypothetical protein
MWPPLSHDVLPLSHYSHGLPGDTVCSLYTAGGGGGGGGGLTVVVHTAHGGKSCMQLFARPAAHPMNCH